MKYIILGGNGFIGKNLCRYIKERGGDVTSFDLSVCDDRIEGVRYITGSFFDDEVLKDVIFDKDIIIHAISTINPGNSNETYMGGYGNDFVQTIKMCSWIKDTNKKLVFLSSGGTVYGDYGQEVLTEEMLPKPINHYGNVKLCIENALRIFHIQNQLNVIIARISNPYGAGQDFRKGVGFVDAVLKRSINGQSVEIWGSGDVVRDYIYIEDVCKMLYELIQYKGDEYLFNISSGVGISQKEIVEIVQTLGIDVQVEYKEARSVDVKQIVLDNSKIKKVCDFECKSIDEGIKKYYTMLK